MRKVPEDRVLGETDDTVTINPLSVAAVYIEMYFDNTLLACGTAFFVTDDEKLYLVTNWHNLSGRYPDSGKPMHQHAALPNAVKVYKHDLAKE